MDKLDKLEKRIDDALESNLQRLESLEREWEDIG